MEKAITAQIQKYRNTYISIIKGKRREVSMDIKQIKENKIKMILQFSIPSIIAMLLQTVITITDGYFTGNHVGRMRWLQSIWDCRYCIFTLEQDFALV